MDKLLEALTEAVRLGTAYAMPALVGYYVVRVTEVLIPALAAVIAISIIGRTIRVGMTLYYEKSKALWDAYHDAYRAYTLARQHGLARDYHIEPDNGPSGI